MDIAKQGRILLGSAVIGSASLLSACVVQAPPPQPAPQLVLAAAPSAGPCNSCGVISSIQVVNPSDYRVTIHMDTGAMQTLDQPQQPAFQVGDRVQVLKRTSQ